MRKSLSDMSLEELWALFPIILQEYNPDYPEWYVAEKDMLESFLHPTKLKRMSHIGSTAVQGLIAKPTIDMLLELDPNCDMNQIKEALTGHGWTLMSEQGQPHMKLSYNKGYTPDGYADRVYHLHVRHHGDWDELYFRDYLQAHEDIAAAYGKMKLDLLGKYKHNRDGYTDAKAEFVHIYTERARQQLGDVYSPRGD